MFVSMNLPSFFLDLSFSVSLRTVTFIGEYAFAGKYLNPFCLAVLVWWVGFNAAVVFVKVSSMLYVSMYL
jgi:hypothetical protein